MSLELPAVAKNFFTNCKKCGVERYHKVLAHVDAKTAKLECEVCHKKSTYKLKNPNAKTRASAKKISVVVKEWETFKDKVEAAKATPYRMDQKFQMDSVINHPHFGLGYIKTAEPNKITVVFEIGTKALIHNRAP